MKKFVLAVFLVTVTEAINCQARVTSNAFQLQLETFGPGGLASLNIDGRFGRNDNGLGFRLGFGYTPLGVLVHSCNTGGIMSLPGGLNFLVGKKQHHLELAVGGTAVIISSTKIFCLGEEHKFFDDETESYFFLSAGYRYQPVKKKGLTYRAFVSPLFQKNLPAKFWGGASIGYRF